MESGLLSCTMIMTVVQAVQRPHLILEKMQLLGRSQVLQPILA